MLRLLVAPFLLLTAASAPGANEPEIRTSDVGRFYALYDATGGKPSAEQLQAYIDGGTDGLKAFAAMRKTTGERIAQAMAIQPQLYASARDCAKVLPAAKVRLGKALARLKQLYPQAVLSPVTIAVGRGKPVGTADKDGVMIGQEALCGAPTGLMTPDLEDRFVHIIAHEYVHVQQAQFAAENPEATVLEAALAEGGAEFVGELIAGSVGYVSLAPAMKGREKAFETAFLADMDKPANGSAWLYNHPGTKERPADLGYWVGYRIAKAYYRRAKDKRMALRDIIELGGAKAFLIDSGWTPGMKFD